MPEPDAEPCRLLKTKMDYVTRDVERPSGRPVEWDEDLTRGGTAHKLYCRHTFTVLGPDDDIVGPKVCVPGRACYEAPPLPDKTDDGEDR
jgi:hypothetical protein